MRQQDAKPLIIREWDWRIQTQIERAIWPEAQGLLFISALTTGKHFRGVSFWRSLFA